MKKTSKLSKVEKEDIYEFQRFLEVCGFKRTAAAIFGYLVLAKNPATAEQVAMALDLSQGAVSTGLGDLAHWGGIASRYDSKKGAQVHSAIQDNFKIVASIFKRREKDAVTNIKNVTQSAVDRYLAEGDPHHDERIVRLKSIVLAAETGETVINFILSLSELSDQKKVYRIVKALPKTLDLLLVGSRTLGDMASKIKGILRPTEGKQPWL